MKCKSVCVRASVCVSVFAKVHMCGRERERGSKSDREKGRASRRDTGHLKWLQASDPVALDSLTN